MEKLFPPFCTVSLACVQQAASSNSDCVSACLAAQSRPTLCDPMEFSRQEYWSGLPFLSSGDLPDPGIEPVSLTLRADSSPCEPPGKPSFPKTTQLISNNTKLKTR